MAMLSPRGAPSGPPGRWGEAAAPEGRTPPAPTGRSAARRSRAAAHPRWSRLENVSQATLPERPHAVAPPISAIRSAVAPEPIRRSSWDHRQHLDDAEPAVISRHGALGTADYRLSTLPAGTNRAIRSGTGSLLTSAHAGHSRRMSRCATTPWSADPILYASMPMSRRRVTASAHRWCAAWRAPGGP